MKSWQSNSQVLVAAEVIHPSMAIGLTSWVIAQQDFRRTFRVLALAGRTVFPGRSAMIWMLFCKVCLRSLFDQPVSQ